VDLSIIIINYNVRDFLLNSIQSIYDNVTGVKYEIIVVDNASSDGSVESLKIKFPDVKVIANSENVGFACANNQGYAESSGAHLLLLNPDTLIKGDVIQSALTFMEKTPDAGITGCRLLNPDGTLQRSIQRFPSVTNNLLKAFFLDGLFLAENRKGTYYRPAPLIIDYCSGAFMMVRREALKGSELLNDAFFMYSEEKDLALRLKKSGWKTYFIPFGEIIHFGGQSTGQMSEKIFLELQKSQATFYAAHYSKHKALALSFSWWLLLANTGMASLPSAILGKDLCRARLFIMAARNWPKIAREIVL